MPHQLDRILATNERVEIDRLIARRERRGELLHRHYQHHANDLIAAEGPVALDLHPNMIDLFDIAREAVRDDEHKLDLIVLATTREQLLEFAPALKTVERNHEGASGDAVAKHRRRLVDEPLGGHAVGGEHRPPHHGVRFAPSSAVVPFLQKRPETEVLLLDKVGGQVEVAVAEPPTGEHQRLGLRDV